MERKSDKLVTCSSEGLLCIIAILIFIPTFIILAHKKERE